MKFKTQLTNRVSIDDNWEGLTTFNLKKDLTESFKNYLAMTYCANNRDGMKRKEKN